MIIEVTRPSTEPNTLMASPLVRITWPASRSAAGLLAYEPISREYHEISDSVVELLCYLGTARPRDEILNILQQSGLDRNAAERLLESLVDSRILTTPNEMIPYEPWFRAGWVEALRYELSSRNVDFVDAGEGGSKRRLKFLEDCLLDGPPEFSRTHATSRAIELPRPPLPDHALQTVLLSRRTSRKFGRAPIPLSHFGGILFHGMAEVRNNRERASSWRQDPTVLLRSYGSAFELYPVVLNVEGVDPGVYHYSVEAHELRLLREGDFSQELRLIARGSSDSGILSGGVFFVLTAAWPRYMWRYRHARAYRMLMITGSQCVQSLTWAATAYGAKNFLSPAIDESRAEALLGLDGWSEGAFYELILGM